MHTVNGDDAVVPMYRWRIVVHKAGTKPFRVAHAFSRFRNRAGAPRWIAACGRNVDALDFAQNRADGDDRCFACMNAVDPSTVP